jgi:hypothetical protein
VARSGCFGLAWRKRPQLAGFVTFFLFGELAFYELSLVRIVKYENLTPSAFGYPPIASVAIPCALPRLPRTGVCEDFYSLETSQSQTIILDQRIHKRIDVITASHLSARPGTLASQHG